MIFEGAAALAARASTPGSSGRLTVTRVPPSLRPSIATIARSISVIVKIPCKVPPETTGSPETLCSSISSAAFSTGSSGDTVTTGETITSRTLSLLSM